VSNCCRMIESSTR